VCTFSSKDPPAGVDEDVAFTAIDPFRTVVAADAADASGPGAPGGQRMFAGLVQGNLRWSPRTATNTTRIESVAGLPCSCSPLPAHTRDCAARCRLRTWRDGDRHAVSAGASAANPAWYHNVLTHPAVTIEVGAAVLDAAARIGVGPNATPGSSGSQPNSRNSSLIRPRPADDDRPHPARDRLGP
jgi:hypothetical protein